MLNLYLLKKTKKKHILNTNSVAMRIRFKFRLDASQLVLDVLKHENLKIDI